MERPSPCAVCKFHRRRCAIDCIFAPHFPSDDPHKFDVVRRVFGTRKVKETLEGRQVNQRGETVNSLVDEAKTRLRDPVNGSAGVISLQQYQVLEKNKEISMLKNQLSEYKMKLTEAENENSELRKKLAVAQAHELDLNHEADKRGKRKEAFETDAAECSDAAVKRMRPTLDLNQPPSDQDEYIMP